MSAEPDDDNRCYVAESARREQSDASPDRPEPRRDHLDDWTGVRFIAPGEPQTIVFGIGGKQAVIRARVDTTVDDYWVEVGTDSVVSLEDNR